MQIDVKRVLMLWGGYVRFTGCRGYPTMQSFMRESPEMRTQRRYLMRLDDETLEKVDKQVRKLKEKNEQHFDILFSRYVCGLDYRQAVKRTGMSSRTYDGQLALAEYFVEGALIGAEIKIFV